MLEALHADPRPLFLISVNTGLRWSEQMNLRRRDVNLLLTSGLRLALNRHTFASRLVMAGVDAPTVRELGGWRTMPMVQRYSHLAPGHLRAAVERLVTAAAGLEVTRK